MGQVIITIYDKDGAASVSTKSTRCHKNRRIITADKGDQMFRKFGFSPFKKWGKFRERNGGL